MPRYDTYFLMKEADVIDYVQTKYPGHFDKDAVLTVKEHDRCVEGVCADYVGLRVPDRYVFGYGMDYHEQGRNLPAIYAMAE